MPKASEGRAPESSLGEHLARLRTTTGMSLRQVEEATNKEVSNAYLSQLENGKITKPSPNILHSLADVYKCSYEDLMERAGYFTVGAGDTRRRGKAAAFPVGDLSADEEKALLAYLAFYRDQQKEK
jgi:transcriptional regulator with XRE-family HTH domain